MGSGTGFWAALLRASGVDVSCFDVEPPSPEPAAGSGKNQSAAAQNEFHGDCPSFLRVQRGTPAALRDRRWRRHALLLCYPPPQVSLDPNPSPNPNPNPSPNPNPNPDPSPDPKPNQAMQAPLNQHQRHAAAGGAPPVCASTVLTLEEAKAGLEEANAGGARASQEAEAGRARARQEVEAVVRQEAEA